MMTNYRDLIFPITIELTEDEAYSVAMVLFRYMAEHYEDLTDLEARSIQAVSNKLPGWNE